MRIVRPRWRTIAGTAVMQASMTLTLLSAASSATFLVVAGRIVLWSKTSAPGAAPSRTPLLPSTHSSTSWSVRTTTSMIVEPCATAFADGAVWAPSACAASIAFGAISKAVATTLANFNRDNKALPIAPVPTKPIFSISVYLPDPYVINVDPFEYSGYYEARERPRRFRMFTAEALRAWRGEFEKISAYSVPPR